MWCTADSCRSDKEFVSHQRVSSSPERGVDLWELGGFWLLLGRFRGICVKLVQCGKLAFSHRETVHFLASNRLFSAFWHYKNKERLSKGLDVKWRIPSTCLDASRMWFSTGISSINRTFKWLCLKTRQAPQNGQNVHRFQVRTPICHIVPVSHAYGYMGNLWGSCFELLPLSGPISRDTPHQPGPPKFKGRRFAP